jgi:sulfite exporter TauE/SafE
LSDQLINTLGEIRSYLPWISFVAGLGGSLHCVGMCGGLVTATCDKSYDVIRYQMGRLIGYLGLGAVAGLIGGYFNLGTIHPLLSLAPALLIGFLFIFWGYQNYRGKRAEIPTSKFLSKLYTKLWMSFVQKNKNFTKAFFTGLISIFLPCGLLYGIVLGTVSLQHGHEAILSMFFFWLGTVPSMVIAPKIIQRLLKPFKAKLPKTYAISLIVIGLLTISFRIGSVVRQSPEHKNHKTEMSCH